MSLEKSKAYDTKCNPRQLGDKSAERINSPTPHQAPQRERVSISTRPRRSSSPSQRSSSKPRQQQVPTWKDHISPDINMGVPTLMALLEPNVVWRHAHDHKQGCGRAAEAAGCQGSFFDGLDQVSKLAHGVYEGSYWQLLGDLSELESMLARMTRAPALLEEPPLQLPAEPELPKWELFKPVLLPPPEAPEGIAGPQLPPFVEPELPRSVELPPPELLLVPPLPEPWKEVVALGFSPPPVPKYEKLQLPELLLPNAPVMKEPMKPPSNGPPKHGHDWSGKRPFTVPEPRYIPPHLPPAPEQVLPELQPPELQNVELDLMPEMLVVLGWHGGAEEGPEEHAERPDSQASGQAGGQAGLMGPGSSGNTAAGQQGIAGANGGGSGGSGCCDEGQRSRAAGRGGAGAAAQGSHSGSHKQQSLKQLQQAWKEGQSAPDEAAGVPHVWLDFTPPFAEPPPVFLPLKPEAGPEPQLVLPTDLQDMPVYKPPEPQPLPVYSEPPLVLPQWAAPCEPLPVGFLRGTAPVLIMDVSGTMHPARRGQFLRVKKCVSQLLEPEGELATAGSAFDVLAFSGSCWSWSATWAGKRALLDSAMQGSYGSTGRRAGGRAGGHLLPQTSAVARSKVQQQHQQLQQRWQQQQQQQQQAQRPTTAPTAPHRLSAAATGPVTDEEMCAGEEEYEEAYYPPGSSADSSSSTANQQMQLVRRWQEQQGLAVSRPSTAAAAPADAGEIMRTVPRNRRAVTADCVLEHVQQGGAEGVVQQQQQQRQLPGNKQSQRAGQRSEQFGPVLQPTDAEHLMDAQDWVKNWPEAVGNTRLLTALMTAHQYSINSSSGSCGVVGNVAGSAPSGQSDAVDCYYLFSDGLADDGAACLEWVQQQAEAGQPLRLLHTVGFFPRNGCAAGERFLSQLAAATGGTFQVYNADLPTPAAAAANLKNAAGGNSQNAAVTGTGSCLVGAPKVWDSALGAFVVVDLQQEDAATRAERQWAEQQLKDRRLANRRVGRIEPLAVMLEALRQEHQTQRVMPAMAAHQQHLQQLKAAHAAACAAVQRASELAVRHAQRNHAATVQHVQEENDRKVTAAYQAHAAAVELWQQQHQQAIAAWEAAVAEAQAVARAAAALSAAASTMEQQQSAADGKPGEADKDDACMQSANASNSGDSAAAAGVATEGVGLVSTNSSTNSSFTSDLSPGANAEASLLDLDVAAAAGGSQAVADTAGQEQPWLEAAASSAGSAAPAAPAAAGASEQGLVTDDLLATDHSSTSAKLVFPLPALHESHSHSSVSGWGGTPRLPEVARPASAVGGCLSSTAGAGSSDQSSSGAARRQGNSRPKSAVARMSADSSSGSGGGRQRGQGKSRSSTDDGGLSSSLQHQQQLGQVLSSGQQASRRSSRSRPASASAAVHASAASANAAGARGSSSAKGSSDSGGLKGKPAIDAADGAGGGSATAPGSGAKQGSQVIDTGSALEEPADGQQQGQQQQQIHKALSKEERLLSHIQAVDSTNRRTLSHLYQEWHEQVVQIEQHNTTALSLHRQASQQHAAKLEAAKQQQQLWQEQVQQLEAAAKQAYEQAVAEAAVENAKLKKLHDQEVLEKQAKEMAYAQAMAEYAAAQEAVRQQHEAAITAAKAAHAAAVAAAKEHWQQQQIELERAYQQQLEQAQQQHADVVQQVKEQNRVAREVHKQAAEAHRAAALENKRRLVLAQEQQEAAAAQLAADNEAALQQARQDYKLMCLHIEQIHQQQLVAAQQEWLAAKAAVQQHNDEELAAARARYAAAIEALMQQHQDACQQLRQQHESELARVRARNEEIMPQVQVARLAVCELARVKMFAAHMRRCAAKLQLGVNFLAGTPNLDRVVEMSALTDALKAAFPEVDEPRNYPWPVTEGQSLQQQQQQQQQWQREGLSRHHTAAGQQQQQQELQQRLGSSTTRYASPRGPAAGVGWGGLRPGTAPAAAGAGCAAAGASVGSVWSATLSASNKQGARSGWRAKSPTTISLPAAFLGPAELLLQLRRRQSSRSSRNSSQAAMDTSSSLQSTGFGCTAAGSAAGGAVVLAGGRRGQRAVQQQQMHMQRPSTACGGQCCGHGSRSSRGQAHRISLQLASPPVVAAATACAAGVPAVQPALLQRPSTAPVGDLAVGRSSSWRHVHDEHRQQSPEEIITESCGSSSAVQSAGDRAHSLHTSIRHGMS